MRFFLGGLPAGLRSESWKNATLLKGNKSAVEVDFQAIL